MERKYPDNDAAKYTTEEEWYSSLSRIYKHCIDISLHQVPLLDYDFWCVAFEREDGSPLYRKDADRNEVIRITNAARSPSGGNNVQIWREFVTTENPHHWVVWPHSDTKGWGEKISRNL